MRIPVAPHPRKYLEFSICLIILMLYIVVYLLVTESYSGFNLYFSDT